LPETIDLELPLEAQQLQPTILNLPAAPPSENEEVKAWEQPVDLLSYLPAAPDLNPMFLEKRVYQGSSGDVYPLPLIDRIASEPVVKSWKAIHLENSFVRLMVLPEIGGRIHVGFDKINGYDFFYRQNVIKPALVGLAGPWVSGGVEFNWPQHHRPATFMPVETEIERHQDGSVTIWCSDYDRASGMKGMHGVCLHPDSAVVELKARLYNGTEAVQTFLWWANVAARVHEGYQSFFPPDVRHVADHARRAISSFPLADGSYYGVNYAERAAHGVPPEEVPASYKPDGYPANDLSRYANIPVPTSYMIVDTQGDFFGGYDHHAQAGFVHVANHHIAPGKKQWTWGNHEFGYAWDRSLTNDDGPYVELMAGVYTDNQPDFSYLAPGETKTFSQHWYPLRDCGVPLAANLDAAMRLDATEDTASIAICFTRDIPDALILLKHGGNILKEWEQDVTIESGFKASVELPHGCNVQDLSLELTTDAGNTLSCTLAPSPEISTPSTAVEPALPQEIASLDELYLTGVHLQQYRHATRSPEPYWREALLRDPGDARCNHALARLHLNRCEYSLAETHLRSAIERTTRLNANPQDTEVFYTLGLVLRRLGRLDEAYAALFKATWSASWRAPAYHALAEIDAVRGNLATAANHLELSLRTNTDNLNARNLWASLLRRLGNEDVASDVLAQTSDLDRLDLWSRYLDCVALPENGHQLLALGLAMERGGQLEDAIDVLKTGAVAPPDGAVPLLHIAISRCSEKLGDAVQAERHMSAALEASPDLCFPSGPDHFDLLQYALALHPESANLHAYLANLLYHHRRHHEAIAAWETSTKLDPTSAQVWRNLGIAYFNIHHNGEAARQAFDRATTTAPNDARLLYESDQLHKRLKTPPQTRLDTLQSKRALVDSRDDLTVELATLLNQLGQPTAALDVLLSRQFQPWEGGEGLVLAQFTAAHLALAKDQLQQGQPDAAIDHLMQALKPPASIGEARHLLANSSNLYFWLGRAHAANGDLAAAETMFDRSAAQLGDFHSMAAQPFSEMTFWSGLSLKQLGRSDEAKSLFQEMYDFACGLERETATIDYFATSLPTLLLFDEDPDVRQKLCAKLLRALASLGQCKTSESDALYQELLESDTDAAAKIQHANQAQQVSMAQVSMSQVSMSQVSMASISR
jgi:tetratricopeptide (TPR) repeat protein